MRRIFTALLFPFALAAPLPAMAALSGYFDSAEQITVILQSTEVADAMAQQPIDEIDFETRRADGSLVWNIGSDSCDLEVTLTAVAPEGVGKTTYTVQNIERCD